MGGIEPMTSLIVEASSAHAGWSKYLEKEWAV
jgi:hypothetical protein